MNRISDEKIKAIAAEYLTNGMIKTKALQAVGYTKNYAEHGGLKLFDNDRLKHEIAHQQAKTELKNDITVERLQSNLFGLAEKAEAEGKYSAAVAAYSSLLKSVGGYMADRLPAENLAGKAIDAKRAEDLRHIADMYYASKYLAQPAYQSVITIESIDMKSDISDSRLPALPGENDSPQNGKPSVSPIQQNVPSPP